jgi:hypothetical protein
MLDNADYKELTLDEINDIINKFANNDMRPKDKSIKKSKFGISSSYLSEILNFSSLDTESWKNKKIGVIGTKGVFMYADKIGKNKITEIPKGTIIPLLKEHVNEKTTYEDENFGGEFEVDFYKFNNEYNYWYETEYQGKKGFVFGSYIVREGVSLDNIISTSFYLNRKNESPEWERLIRLAYYYTKESKSDKFYNFNGIVSIPAKIQKALVKDKIALEEINFGDYIDELNIDNPDDMIVLYKILHSDKTATTFITLDFLNHNLHLLFDRMLQETEQRSLYPILKFLMA